MSGTTPIIVPACAWQAAREDGQTATQPLEIPIRRLYPCALGEGVDAGEDKVVKVPAVVHVLSPDARMNSPQSRQLFGWPTCPASNPYVLSSGTVPPSGRQCFPMHRSEPYRGSRHSRGKHHVMPPGSEFGMPDPVLPGQCYGRARVKVGVMNGIFPHNGLAPASATSRCASSSRPDCSAPVGRSPAAARADGDPDQVSGPTSSPPMCRAGPSNTRSANLLPRKRTFVSAAEGDVGHCLEALNRMISAGIPDSVMTGEPSWRRDHVRADRSQARA